jgi:hypothetical protein
METNADPEQAERPTEDEPTGTHQGKPVAGLDDGDDPGTIGSDKPKPA